MRQARTRGVESAVAFSGILSGQAMADALARCDVLLSINAGGPSSRKGSLAGALSSAAPVIALDGPRRWEELVSRGAIALAERAPQPLADAVVGLLADPATATELGARGRRFAEQEMGVQRTVAALEDLFEQLGLRT
jgi:glycosyltransferase involved in cell wall biosynthesis